MISRCLRLVLPLVLLLFATPSRAAKLHCPRASADPNQDHQIALRYHHMGLLYQTKGDYRLAASAFDCVLNLSDKIPLARLHLAQAYDKLGQFALARLHYDLALKDTNLAAEHAAIRLRIAELAGKPDRATAPNADDEVSRPDFDREAPGPTEKDDAPAEPTIAELRDQLAELSRREGLTRRTIRPCPTPRPAPSLTSRWWFWTGLGAAAVFTGAGLYGSLRAGSLADDWKRDPDAGVHDDLRAMQRLSASSLTGAVLTLGAVLIAAWATEPDAPPPALPRHTNF